MDFETLMTLAARRRKANGAPNPAAQMDGGVFQEVKRTQRDGSK